MSQNTSKRRQTALQQIAELKAQQKQTTIKIVAVTLTAAVIVLAVQYLGIQGVIDTENTMTTAICMIIICFMAIFDGMATRDYTKARDEVARIQAKTGISDSEIKEFMKG